MLPPVLVTVPITESADQRKARESRKEPLPHISYVAHSVGYVADNVKENDDDRKETEN